MSEKKSEIDPNNMKEEEYNMKEEEYNSVRYYVDRLFSDELLEGPKPLEADYRKYLYYFIDMPNLFNSDRSSDVRHLLSPEQEYGDIFSSFIIDTLIYLLFDYMWEPSDQSEKREKKTKITLYEKIRQDPTKFYIGLNFFTKRSNNPYRNEFCFKTSESSRYKDHISLNKIDLLPDLVDYIKYSNNNDYKIEQLLSLLNDGDKLKVDATINYSNIYCCNEYSLRDNFKYTLRSNSEITGNNDGFLDENSKQIKFTSTEEINLNCSKVSIVDEDGNTNDNQNLKLPRNLPIDPELVKFYDELQKFSNSNIYNNSTGPIHSLNSYDDINLLKWYTYFYHYFFVDERSMSKGKNVYLSIISNDRFRWAEDGSFIINNNSNFSETEFFFNNTIPNNFKEVKKYILQDIAYKIAITNGIKNDREITVDKDFFKNEKDLYDERKCPNGYNKSSDFVAHCVSIVQEFDGSKWILQRLSGLPFMERSVGFSITPSTQMSPVGKTVKTQVHDATGVNDHFSTNNFSSKKVSNNFYKKKGGAPIQNQFNGIRLFVKQRNVQGNKILTSTHVNFLPLINNNIKEVVYGYNECNYSEKTTNWLI